MIVLTNKKANMTFWVLKEEISYITQIKEEPSTKSVIIKVNEVEKSTIVLLKGGRTLPVDQEPEDIIKMMSDCKCGK